MKTADEFARDIAQAHPINIPGMIQHRDAEWLQIVADARQALNDLDISADAGADGEWIRRICRRGLGEP